jgi:hypothetical protein
MGTFLLLTATWWKQYKGNYCYFYVAATVTRKPNNIILCLRYLSCGAYCYAKFSFNCEVHYTKNGRETVESEIFRARLIEYGMSNLMWEISPWAARIRALKNGELSSWILFRAVIVENTCQYAQWKKIEEMYYFAAKNWRDKVFRYVTALNGSRIL